MDIGSKAVSLILICLMSAWKVDSYECMNNSWTNGNSYSIPNKIFKKIQIAREEDLYYRTQLSIKVVPTKDFLDSSCKVILSSTEENCIHYSEEKFILGESLSIPNLDNSEEYLNPGCNYSLVFIIQNYCIQSYYQIPEKRPCENFLPEETFDSFPNEILDNVSIKAFKKNAIRLNISLATNAAFSNINGSIVISSKVARCDHREEFRFSLSESSLVIPRAEYPHSFIDSGCEYMIDFELNNGYCVTTTYKVPDLCLGLQTKAKVTDVVKEQSGIYRILWDSKTIERNETIPISSIVYRLEDVNSEEFNNYMVIEDNFNSSYSLLNFSRLTKPGIYRLIATFENEKECSHVSSFDFEVRGDPGVLIFILASTVLIFGVAPAICMCVPTLRSKILQVTKRLFDKTMVQVHAPDSGEPIFFDIRRKEEINLSYVPIELKNCDEFEFPLKFRKLEYEPDTKPVVSNFSEVYIAKAYGINKTGGFATVAVKRLKANAPVEDEQALIEEISTLRKIASQGNHENVVRMLACCSIQKPYMILLEYVPCGDLKKYLINLRDEWLDRKKNRHFVFPSDDNSSYISPNARTISETSSSLPSPTETELTVLYDDTDESLLPPPSGTPTKITPALSNIDLQRFSLQIAKGMAFLESIPVVHRDLAARNVLINEHKVLKISDFGMSRIGDYVHKNTSKQPLRWMAPESIEQFTCTSKSDVWSFGVVLWEIGTLGAFPYDSISDDFILEYLLYSLKKEIRLMRPEICTDELYSLMLKCWSINPDQRPSFQKIVDFLSGEKKTIYLDLRKLSPAYVFPPTKQT